MPQRNFDNNTQFLRALPTGIINHLTAQFTDRSPLSLFLTGKRSI